MLADDQVAAGQQASGAAQSAITDPSQQAQGSMTFWQLVTLHVTVSLVAAVIAGVVGSVFFKRKLKRGAR